MTPKLLGYLLLLAVAGGLGWIASRSLGWWDTVCVFAGAIAICLATVTAVYMIRFGVFPW